MALLTSQNDMYTIGRGSGEMLGGDACTLQPGQVRKPTQLRPTRPSSGPHRLFVETSRNERRGGREEREQTGSKDGRKRGEERIELKKEAEEPKKAEYVM